jgi:hypothetical protein
MPDPILVKLKDRYSKQRKQFMCTKVDLEDRFYAAARAAEGNEDTLRDLEHLAEGTHSLERIIRQELEAHDLAPMPF